MNLSQAIAPSFYDVHKALKEEKFSHYFLKGGRGSTKSSFVAIEIILGMMKDPQSNCVAMRKVKDTLKDSVYEQLSWAIEKLGVEMYWHKSISPLGLTYKPTGQRILFRGLDDPLKLKSIKFSRGYCKFLWFEELSEFSGMEEIRNVNQSLMRGGKKFIAFYSFNPPQSSNNWVNTEVSMTRNDRLVHHSTYLEVPRQWLGEQFFIEAEHLKQVKPTNYDHEYLGEVTGTGGEVFQNVTIRPISDKEIASYWNIKRGMDFGYAVDPFAYGTMHLDKKKKRLYIFHEIYQVGLSNTAAIKLIKKENTKNDLIIGDSAEPKSLHEFRQHGLHVRGAKKGPDSVEYGIKYLQDLEEIVIDDKRCPNAAQEFLNYELEKDAHGNFKAKFPDKNNHYIDLTRYALNDDIMQHKDDKKKPSKLSHVEEYTSELMEW